MNNKKLRSHQSDFFNKELRIIILFVRIFWQVWGWGKIKQGGKRIPFLLLPCALESCLKWQVQYEPRAISIVGGFGAVCPVLPGWHRSSHQPWHFSRHFGLDFTAVMSWWDSFALAQVSPILSSKCWQLAGQGWVICSVIVYQLWHWTCEAWWQQGFSAE